MSRSPSKTKALGSFLRTFLASSTPTSPPKKRDTDWDLRVPIPLFNVTGHGGYISVESEVDAGTAFTFYVPASANSVAEIEENQPLPATEELGPIGNGHILVMDDEEMIREALGELLKELGYDVAFARDGVEAIALYRETLEQGLGFDAVIMDLTIPGGMGGERSYPGTARGGSHRQGYCVQWLFQ